MEKKKPNGHLIFLLIGVCVIAIIGISSIYSFVVNNKQDIEQYYIDYKSYVKQESDAYSKSWQIITSNDEYVDMFNDKSEVLKLLQDVVDKDFFKTKSLIIFEDIRRSNRVIASHISDVSIKNNTATITIKNDENPDGVKPSGISIRTYFIPINSKSVTMVESN